MRTLLYLVTALGVMALAFWAYRENYRTQAAMDRMQGVQTEMAGLRERLGMLRAEWAFLNRPERLAQLVRLNEDKLQLQPLTPGQFVNANQIAFPAPRAPEAVPGLGGPLDPLLAEPSRNPGAPPRRPQPAGPIAPPPAAVPAPRVPGTTTATMSDDPAHGDPSPDATTTDANRSTPESRP